MVESGIYNKVFPQPDKKPPTDCPQRCLRSAVSPIVCACKLHATNKQSVPIKILSFRVISISKGGKQKRARNCLAVRHGGREVEIRLRYEEGAVETQTIRSSRSP